MWSSTWLVEQSCMHLVFWLCFLETSLLMWKVRFASNIIMGRLCYCCLNFLNIRADQLVDRLASTRDIYISRNLSCMWGVWGRERGSVQFSHLVLSHSLTTWTAASAQHLEYCNAYWKPKKNQNSQFKV